MSQMASNSVSAGIAAALQMSAVTGTAVVSSQSIGSSSTTTTPTSPILTNSTENISPNKKDKPKKTMSTILPWTKGITNQVQCFFSCYMYSAVSCISCIREKISPFTFTH